MLNESQLNNLVARIRNVNVLADAPIGYYGGRLCRMLDSGPAGTGEPSQFIVVVEEFEGTVPGPANGAAARNTQTAQRLPHPVHQRSQVSNEAVSALIDCSFAAMSWVAVAGATVGAPATGGTSLIGAALAWTGAITGTMLCVNGITRLTMTPQERQVLDHDPTYQGARAVVSGANLMASGGSAARGVFRAAAGVQVAEFAGDALATAYGVQGLQQGGSSSLPRLPASRTSATGTSAAGMSSLLVHVFPRGSNQSTTVEASAYAANNPPSLPR